MILLAHPSGNNFVRETAMAFFDAKALRELHLGIAACGGNGFAKLSRLPGMAEIRRRTYDSRLRSTLRLHPWREGGRLLASRLGWRSLIAHETGPFCIDAVFETFDRSVARRVATLCMEKGSDPNSAKHAKGRSGYWGLTPFPRPRCISGVYCYEDGALKTFRAAKAAGIVCCYDLPIAYWRTARRLLEEEAKRWPQWEPTLVGTRDSAAKCARKDAELELADLIVCPSSFVRDSLPSEVLLSKTVAVIPFGSPDSPRDFPSRKKEPEYDVELNRDDLNNHSRLRILFAGSMTQRKGLADLFAAMKLLDLEKVELHVMGSPIVPIEFYRSQYPHFVYHATRSNADVLKLMQTMDVFCLPSIVEGRALVIQEAMSQGLPIIITPNTGGEDLVDVTSPFGMGHVPVDSIQGEPIALATGDAQNMIPTGSDMTSEASAYGSGVEKIYGRGATGFLVPIRSPETIAECIAWCYDHREEVVSMGKAAMRKSQEYTWKAYGDGIVYAVQDAVRAR
ncbi:MAG: glycosyltransferase family 4 protein [Pirellula sp.]|nr:glycosyltransferase family 4 protein [Pirellula sp.]